MQIFVVLSFSALAVLCASVQPAMSNEFDNDIGDGSMERPLLKCISGSDCGQQQCSVMGMQRFSEPRCEPLGGLGAPCRPYQEPDDKVLHFPHAIMECQDVYLQFCPCGKGLECIRGQCRMPRLQAPAQRRPRINNESRVGGADSSGSTSPARATPKFH